LYTLGNFHPNISRVRGGAGGLSKEIETERENEGCTIDGAVLRKGATMCPRLLYKVLGGRPPLPLRTAHLTSGAVFI